MRLRWESATPPATARWLATLLSLPVTSPDGVTLIDLGGAILEIAEPAGADSTDERLRVLNTAPAAAARRTPSVGFVAVGFATVDTERAANERAWRIRAAASDHILGADVSVVIDPARVLLLEPHTEGRLAASLVRWGEGPAALYLAPAAGLERAREAARARGGRVTSVSTGPFGREFAVLGPRIWGPHIVLAESDAMVLVESDAMPPSPGTIDG